MSGTTTGIVVIVVVVVVALAAWLGLVARAAQHPSKSIPGVSRCAGSSRVASTSAAGEASHRTAMRPYLRAAAIRRHRRKRTRPRTRTGPLGYPEARWICSQFTMFSYCTLWAGMAHWLGQAHRLSRAARRHGTASRYI